MILWSSHDFDVHLALPSSQPWEATGVSIDTRTLQKGDIFFALQGPCHDGNTYIEEAFAKGAACCVTQRQDASLYGPSILSHDPYETLYSLAQISRRLRKAKVIALTGSAGKTSTKDLLLFLLQGQGWGTVKNLNNHIGVPLSMVRTPPTATYTVLEVGLSFPREIQTLSMMIQPDIAILLNVHHAHIQNFENFESLIQSKSDIFLGLSPTGVGILNRDQEDIFERNRQTLVGHKIFSFGRHPESDAQLLSTDPINTTDMFLSLRFFDRILHYTIKGRTQAKAMNLLPALLTLEALGLPLPLDHEKINFTAPEGRQNIIHCGSSFMLIDGSYNANPASFSSILEEMSRIEVAHTLLILGDMNELGKYAQENHEAVSAKIKDHLPSALWVIGSHWPKALTKNNISFHSCSSAEQAGFEVVQYLKNLPQNTNTLIAIKGSNSFCLWKVKEAILEAFPLLTPSSTLEQTSQ